MKFDVIIIGGGLSGLTCGISLSSRGVRTALVSAGQSSLYFNTGSFDLLGWDAAGKPVSEPLKALEGIPVYRQLSGAGELAGRAEKLLRDAGLEFEGSAETNSYRTTPLGIRRPCWLVLKDVPQAVLPWDKSGPGLHIQQALVRRFRSLGGLVLVGDAARDGKIENGRVTGISTEKLGSGAISASRYVLASGSFMNRGLVSTAEEVQEPVFGSDVVSAPVRTDLDVFAPQPYMGFGVATDASFRVLKDGSPVSNLYAAGQILAGNDPIKYGNAEGVQMLSALQVADNIMKEAAL